MGSTATTSITQATNDVYQSRPKSIVSQCSARITCEALIDIDRTRSWADNSYTCIARRYAHLKSDGNRINKRQPKQSQSPLHEHPHLDKLRYIKVQYDTSMQQNHQDLGGQRLSSCPYTHFAKPSGFR